MLLFRLQMTIRDVIEKFEEIAEDLFSPRVFGKNLHKLGILGYWLGNAYVHWKELEWCCNGFPRMDKTEGISPQQLS